MSGGLKFHLWKGKKTLAFTIHENQAYQEDQHRQEGNIKPPREECFFERCSCAPRTSSAAAWQNRTTFPKQVDRKEHACAHLPLCCIQRLEEPAGHFTPHNKNMKDPGSSDDLIQKPCECSIELSYIRWAEISSQKWKKMNKGKLIRANIPYMAIKRIYQEQNTKRPWEERFLKRCGCASATSSIAAWQNRTTFPEKLDRKEHERSWKNTHVLTYHCTAFRGWRSAQATSPHKTQTWRTQVLCTMRFWNVLVNAGMRAPAAKHPLLNFNAL